MKSPPYNGFTLIELSIVLVVIGLIVGGVLVGQDLIRSAEIRAQISQIEKYNTAVNTFYGKYAALPGDMKESLAASLGFWTGGMNDSVRGLGDGNESIDCPDGGVYPQPCVEGESLVFWIHLSEASIIDGGFNSASSLSSSATGAAINLYVPLAKIEHGNSIFVYGQNGYNYFQIQGVTELGQAGAYGLANAMTPLQAYMIDTKVDDGAPLSGRVQATDGSGAGVLTTPAASDGAGGCALTGPPATYDIGPLGANLPNCGLQLRFN